MQPGDLISDRYLLLDRARAGGMADVWRARDRTTDAVVALKVMRDADPRDIERFEQEARMMASLSVPGVVRHASHGLTPEGAHFIAMEWLEGEDLRERLRRQGLTLGESLTLARRVAATLAAVHARGIVHRDVKPSNLFLVDGEVAKVKVLDFGVARASDSSLSPTRTGAVVGTPAYMAPEQARGDRSLDARVDVFALGCVLFACLTGRPAFKGENMVAILAKIILEDPPRVRELRPELDPALDALVARMTAKSREDRPRDGAAVLAELDALGDLALGDLRAAPVDDHQPSITGSEQRFLSVVVCGTDRLSLTTTLAGSEPDTASAEQLLRASVKRFGAELEWLLDGSLVAWISGRGTATDQAREAARCALALRKHLPGVPIVLATARGMVSERLPVGEVIDRAAQLLELPSTKPAAAGPVLVDEVTAGLLDARFELVRHDGLVWLAREHDVNDDARTLLGKPTSCVGRSRELGILASVFDECVAEPVARAVLVTAPAGFGKSRLRYEFLRQLRTRHPEAEIWVGRGEPLSAGSPFGLLRRALRGAFGLRDGAPVEAQRAALRERAALHVAPGERDRAVEFLGELIGTPANAEPSEQLRAARQNAVLLGDQIRRAWEDFVVAECRARPVLLVLEDLHWGDIPTVKLVDSALRHARELPLLVLALGRPEVADTFPKLWADKGLTEIRLSGLTRRASEQLVREALGAEATAELTAQMVERAGGNAFYLEELIRSVASGSAAELPATVLAMAQSRLDALDPDARRLLRAASVFGDAFWLAGVASLVGEAQTTFVREWLEVLADQELVTRRAESRFSGEEELVFRHALLREAAYATLTDADRKLGHRLAGQWLQKAGEGDAIVLAEHFERGGLGEQAGHWYLTGANEALAGNDLDAALTRAERALELGKDPDLQARGRLTLATTALWRGDIPRAETEALEAVRQLPELGEDWFRAVGDLIDAAIRVSHIELAVEWVDTLCEKWPHRPSLDAAGSAICRSITSMYMAGRKDRADKVLDLVAPAEAEIFARAPLVAGHLLRARAGRELRFTKDLGAFVELSRTAIGFFDRAGDSRNAALQRTNCGFGLTMLGAPEAEETLRTSSAEVDRIGLQLLVVVCDLNLGMVLEHRGARDEAIALLTKAIAALTQVGDHRLLGAAYNYRARVRWAMGDHARAEADARAALAVAGSFESTSAASNAVLAFALLGQDRNDEALAAARQGLALLEKLGGIEEGEELIRLAHAEALHATGDGPAARAAITDARDRVLARADAIRDPKWRASFLANVPMVVRTLELADAWTA